MIKCTFLPALLCCFSLLLSAQQDYWQQTTNYQIDVTLDDATHRLDGNIVIDYTNHSPNSLDTIWMHLWANAFKDRKTAFAKQKLRTQDAEFYFAPDSLRGFYEKLNFTVDDKAVAWKLDRKDIDIAYILLDKPLAPGSSIRISTPFSLKIPTSFSRLGHVGQSYQMTQWYPKPAVYDKDGWHAMPYLDAGEFYSEFGSFDVKITLPENYVVAATGELQTASEIDWLMERVEKTKQQIASGFSDTDTFPTSSTQMKTIHYRAEQVHDFAWFADKRFHVQKSAVKFNNDRTVDTWVFFTNVEAELWTKAIEYVDRSLKFYSELVGDYPYPQATAVQSALSAGAGMEYPMITVIGLAGKAQALDEVITHEVGHNWFYGILAFDEREHPWMDEGINSYYDHRYTDQYYGNRRYFLMPENVFKKSDANSSDLAYWFQARRRIDQAPETTSDDFTMINYYLGAYEKPARVFEMLEHYLGREKFDPIMQSFYRQWQFKHPQPEDLRAHFERESGKSLGWVFDDLIGSNRQINYALQKIASDDNNYQLTIANRGDISSPFPLAGIKDDKIVTEKWVEGFSGIQQVAFPAGEYDRIVIDPKQVTLEVNRQNNSIKTSGMIKRGRPLNLKFAFGFDHSQKNTVFWTPLIGYNDYDKVMLGLALYNRILTPKNLEFSFAPMWGTGSNELVGLGNIQYNFFAGTEKGIRRMSIGTGFRRFYYENEGTIDEKKDYYQFLPKFEIELKKRKENNLIDQFIYGGANLLYQKEFVFNGRDFVGTEYVATPLFSLGYIYDNKRVVNPFSLRAELRQSNYDTPFGEENFLRAQVELNTSYTYQEDRHLDFRFFVGKFISHSRKDRQGIGKDPYGIGNFRVSFDGFNDNFNEELFFGRSADTAFFSQQIYVREGGFKVPLTNFPLSNGANDLLLAINFKADLPADLPLGLPLKPYFDIAYLGDDNFINPEAPFSEHLLFNGGLMLDWLDGRLAVYFPLVSSDNIKQIYNQRNGGKYPARITYTIDLGKINPLDLLYELEF